MKGKMDRRLILRLLTALIIPSATCMIYCALRGRSIFSLYMPDCINNDSLFYYKVVETALAKNRGFFGYNDSRALVGFFPVWSPFLFIPWIICGAVFGWGYSSILVFNVVVLSLAVCAFTLLTDMDLRGLLTLFLCFLLFPSLSIHILNALPETMVTSMLILYFGFALNDCIYEEKKHNTVLMLIISMYMTVFRPFMIFLVIYPCIRLIKTKKAKSVLMAGFFCLIPMAAYFLCNHYFAAKYYEVSVDMSFFDYLLHGHLLTAVRHIAGCFRGFRPELRVYVQDAFRYGLTAGTHYVLVFALILLLLPDAFKKEKTRNISILYIITCLGTITANIILYRRVNEGGRHFFGFAVAGICLLCVKNRFDVKGVIRKVAILALLITFVLRGAMIPTDYDIPGTGEGLKADIEYWNETFNNKVDIKETSGYDNNFLWVFSENIEGENKLTDFRQLFALPKGCGISCAKEEYITDNFDDLKSRYIACISGGGIDRMCLEHGLLEIGRTKDLVIFSR